MSGANSAGESSSAGLGYLVLGQSTRVGAWVANSSWAE